MRVIIAGGRDFNDYELLKRKCDRYMSDPNKVFQVISGMAKGADMLGVRYAKERDLYVQEYPADWDKYGKAAGAIRNAEMAEVAECLIAFYNGSPGTTHMIKEAKKKNLKIRIVRY